MNTPFIEFRNITKRFNGNTILDHVNLSIYENQVTTIIGKSGTGKSVLLKHIAGLLTPDEGEIFLEGKPLSALKKAGEWDSYRTKISYMFQNNALFDSMTVFENVAFPLIRTTRLTTKEITEKVKVQLKQMDLNDVGDKYPAQLSGGMQKRVALARALVTNPRVVLFDEPTTGQDLVRRNIILSMISQYKKKFGFTAVLISHDIPDVLFISDRVMILWEGAIVFQGNSEAAFNLQHPIIDEFLMSLEGFQDELTGLLSKQMFRSRYAMTFGHKEKDLTGSAVLFSVKFDLLAETLGHRAAVDIVKTVGEFINHHLGAMGGFSTRLRRGQIMTIIPHVNLEEARETVTALSKILQNEALPSIESVTQAKMGIDTCFDIYISAGIAETRSNDDMEKIYNEADNAKKTIAVYRCGREE